MGNNSLAEFIAARLDEDQEHGEQCRHAYHGGKELREVAAKRAILALHEPQKFYGNNRELAEPCIYCTCQEEDGMILAFWPCETMRALAGVWSDHPGYRAEWKP